MQAQMEDIHIAMYPNVEDPYKVDDPAKVNSPFASPRVNMAGVHVYSATAKVWSFVAGMDGAMVVNPVGVIQSYLSPPLNRTTGGPIYHAHSLNTTAFRKGRTYEVSI